MYPKNLVYVSWLELQQKFLGRNHLSSFWNVMHTFQSVPYWFTQFHSKSSLLSTPSRLYTLYNFPFFCTGLATHLETAFSTQCFSTTPKLSPLHCTAYSFVVLLVPLNYYIQQFNTQRHPKMFFFWSVLLTSLKGYSLMVASARCPVLAQSR